MTCHCATLHQESLLHLTGPDATAFLQGQVTCDTRALGPATAMPGIYCTVKGRVICDFLLCQLGEEHLALRLRRDIRAASAAALAKYIVFSKAQLEPGRDDWQLMACWGASAATVLEEVFGVVPQGKFAAACGDGFTLIQIDQAGQQFECYLDHSSAVDWQLQLQAAAQPATEQAWQALQIAAGTARIETATSEEYVPQVLNYDLTGHISFNKGCYTGQEVVARLHYRGKSKRRLYLASIALTDPSEQLPVPGDPLFSADGQSVGNVINCVNTKDGDLTMLITATSTGVESGLRLCSTEGPSLTVGAVPYPVPES